MEKTDVNALAQQMVGAVKHYVAQAEARILQNVDAKLAAVPAAPAGPAGPPGPAGADAPPDTKQAAAFESLERRASRHADHLGTLESRVQTLEHGKGKK